VKNWFQAFAFHTRVTSSRYAPDATLYPSDLVPFTRRPLFVIVDGNASRQFHALSEPGGHMPGGEVPVVLGSPLRLPSRGGAAREHTGAFFTLFLTSPLAGMCALCGSGSVLDVPAEAAARFAAGALYKLNPADP
jgi:hypothetical protein